MDEVLQNEVKQEFVKQDEVLQDEVKQEFVKQDEVKVHGAHPLLVRASEFFHRVEIELKQWKNPAGPADIAAACKRADEWVRGEP